MKPRWHIYPNVADLCGRAASAITRLANHAIIKSGAFHIVLAGGSTPRTIYRALINAPTDWPAWHVYFGDERCLASDDRERNSVMAFDALLRHVAIPPNQVHIIEAELGSEEGARRYVEIVEKVPRFDLVLLGLGEDGHTASLFPQSDWGVGIDSPAVIPIFNAPKLPAQRVSLSANRLSSTEHAMFIVTGLSKQSAVTNWFSGESLPAASITPINGVDVFMEAICLNLKSF